MSSIEEEGQRIAERLGQGVTYRGPWFPYGPNGKFLGYFFQDDAVTGSSFVAKTFEEAKASLIEMRKDFGAKPPVFDNNNNPGSALMTKEEWDQVFRHSLPVVSIGLGVLSLALGIVSLRSKALAQRVYYQDNQCLVSVRYPGEFHDIREFVQPANPDVLAIYSQFGPNYWSLYDFVCRNINYRRDVGEFWQTPSETLARNLGDCEDTSLLLCSLLRNSIDAHVALGSFQGYGHAWCELKGEILETTYTFSRQVPDPQDYHPYVCFNDQEVVECWPGAVEEIFELQRNEAMKLSLMVEAIG